MLKPRVEIHDLDGLLVAEFWDCLRLDQGAVQDLRPRYEEHVKKGGRPALIVDLLGVGFAGSSALGHFVSLQRVVRSNKGRVVFCNVDPTVFEVFRVSKLDPLFAFVADRPAALALVDGTDKAGAGEDASPPSPPRKAIGGGLLRSSQRRKLS